MSASKPEVVITPKRNEIEFHCVGHGRKCGCSRWNFVDISFRLGVITTSGLQVAITISGCRPTSDNVGTSSIVSGMVKNVGVAVGISLLSHSVHEL